MSTASIEELQQRIATLEAQMALLLAERNEPAADAWRQTAGMFTGNEVMRAIDEAALQYRKEDRISAGNGDVQESSR